MTTITHDTSVICPHCWGHHDPAVIQMCIENNYAVCPTCVRLFSARKLEDGRYHTETVE